jgi:hypothetical protein
VTAAIKGELQEALDWQDESPVVPAPAGLEELKPKQCEAAVSSNAEDSSTENPVDIIPGSLNDDFVNVEKETDDKDIVDADSSARRRKGKKKKN